jgi:hypothetical protein
MDHARIVGGRCEDAGRHPPGRPPSFPQDIGLQAFLIIGNPHTRKSSLLRCLTGCFNRSVRDIALQRGGTVRLYARVAALQESRTGAEAFRVEAERSRCTHTAFSLWPEAHPHDPQQWPDALAYVAALRQAGWQLDKAVMLGAHPLAGVAGLDVLHLPGVRQQPLNLSAQRIRVHFGWL